jgi:hypothetical protein
VRKPALVPALAAMVACCMHAVPSAALEPPVVPPPAILTPPDPSYTYAPPQLYPSLAWTLTQLVPSPEVGGGKVHRTSTDGVQQDSLELAFGLRWQLTPLLYSWGTNRRISRWRAFVVDPTARNSGSIELNTSIEYLFGHIDRFLVRPGIRATFPLLQRGEYLSTSIGTSTYAFNGVPRVAYDVGLYMLFGLFGVQVTVAPAHAPLNFIGTFRIRYF